MPSFPFLSNTLYKSLFAPRTKTIKTLLLMNTALFGTYLLTSGSLRMLYERCFVARPNSSMHSLALFHFSHTSIKSFLINMGIIYVLGNAHCITYGSAHFLKVFGLSALGGSLLTGIYFYSNREGYAAGANAPAAGLITYHAFKNPAWFRMLPYLSLALLGYGCL